MSVSVAWLGLEALEGALEADVERARAGAFSGVTEGLHLIEARMKERAGEGGRHAAGTPTPASVGGGPAVISGSLRRSITVADVIPYGLGGWSGKVGPTVIYGRRIELEYGYQYAGPGYHDALPELPAIFARNWRR